MNTIERRPLIEVYEDSSINIRQEGYEALHDFEPGRVYYQVNLGSRYAVEALARLFKNNDTSIYNNPSPAAYLASELTDEHTFRPGSVAVFVRPDQNTGVELASVFYNARRSDIKAVHESF